MHIYMVLYKEHIYQSGMLLIIYITMDI